MDPAEIESANRLRKTLGLPLLPTSSTPAPAQASNSVTFKEKSSSSDDEPGSTLETRENAGYQNWQDLQDEAEAKKRREQKALAIKKARDAAQKFTRLEGKGLGDIDGEKDLDAKAWLQNSKSRQKKIEAERRRRLEEELAEREKLATVEYGEEDLAGIKVAHEASAFDEIEDEQILTFKDAAIDELEEEDAELENAELREREKLKEKVDLKKRKVYDALSQGESGERTLLSQYDEKKRKAFTLGPVAEERDAKRQAVGDILRAQPISLDILKERPLSDYVDSPENIKIKKPKKNKTKSRQKTDEDDIFPASSWPDAGTKGGHSIDIDRPQTTMSNTEGFSRSSLIDDDDLRLGLDLSRRQAFKKRKLLKPEDIARAIREERSATPDEPEEPAGLVIDETSEFVQNFQKRDMSEKKKSTPKSPDAVSPPSDDEDGDGDVIMREEHAVGLSQVEQAANTPEISATGLEEEATLDGPSLGGALKLLRPRGLLQSSETDLNLHDRQNETFLQKKRRLEIESENRIRLQRLHERESGGSRLSAAEKQELAMYRNQAQSHADSRNLAKLFESEYRPNVTIKHVDDTGRELNVKEAFKHLSHKFHGKGSGAGKTAKMLKKIADEKKREATTALDTSQATGMNNAMGTTAKKNKQAGVRLG
jgi:U4/U6.U5 tri-snRNP-associated protein 1